MTSTTPGVSAFCDIRDIAPPLSAIVVGGRPGFGVRASVMAAIAFLTHHRNESRSTWYLRSISTGLRPLIRSITAFTLVVTGTSR
jgi:hypothetical protein